ncbi:hypothetical protein D9M71_197670 [compost metagenome]
MGVGNHFFSVVRRTKHSDQSGPGRTEGNRARGHRQPALDLGRPHRISRQPTAVAVLLRQIHQNRVGVGQYHALVINDRHLTECIERQERRLLVFTLGEVNEDQFGRQFQQGQHQLDSMRVAGTWEVVEFDRLHGRHLGSVVLFRKASAGGSYLPLTSKTTESPANAIHYFTG